MRFFNYKTISTQLFFDSANSSFNRSDDLTNFILDTRIFVHDGRSFKSLLIKPYHVTYKIGQFIFTRLQTSKIHLRKRKKKERKKRGK